VEKVLLNCIPSGPSPGERQPAAQERREQRAGRWERQQRKAEDEGAVDQRGGEAVLRAHVLGEAEARAVVSGWVWGLRVQAPAAVRDGGVDARHQAVGQGAELGDVTDAQEAVEEAGVWGWRWIGRGDGGEGVGLHGGTEVGERVMVEEVEHGGCGAA